MRLDVARPFPIPSESVDRILCEHLIEHLGYPAALAMLRECHRVLKPGGRMRVATPDLAVIMKLAGRDLDRGELAYVRWSNTEFGAPASEPLDDPIFVINRMMREWGHTFLFDEPLLRDAIHAAGFRDILRCEADRSDDPEFDGVDDHGNVTDRAHNRFETLVLEVTKERMRDR